MNGLKIFRSVWEFSIFQIPFRKITLIPYPAEFRSVWFEIPFRKFDSVKSPGAEHEFDIHFQRKRVLDGRGPELPIPVPKPKLLAFFGIGTFYFDASILKNLSSDSDTGQNWSELQY